MRVGAPRLKKDKIIDVCNGVGLKYVNHSWEKFNGSNKWVVKYSCLKHGELKTSWGSFKQIKGCPECRKENNKEKLITKYYNEFCEIVSSKGGEVLSPKEDYENAHTKLKIVCGERHKYEINLNNLKSGYWCYECYLQKLRHTIEEVKEFARNKGGECLSESYKGNQKDILLWKCENGHVWEDSFYNIKFGATWCSQCKEDEKRRLVETKISPKIIQKLSWVNIKRMARYKGGQVLTKNHTLLDSTTRVKLICGRGHIFDRSANDLVRKDERWCRECNDNKRGILEYYRLKKVAVDRGYKLLSTPSEYKGQFKKYRFLCPNNHNWECSAGNFKGMRSCKECTLDERRIPYERILSFLEKNHGKLLTPYEYYTDSKQLLQWVCANDHIFELNLDSVFSGTWCQICTGRFKNETKCKFIIEKLTNKVFYKNRTLLNNKYNGIKNYLELDMYNEELRVALEYNGEQHYRYIEYFHKHYSEFEESKRRDRLKKKLCNELGIKLIVVPYHIATDKEKYEYIKSKLNSYRVQIKDDRFSMEKYYNGEYKEEII